jgi:hypothetical protein
MKPELTEQDRQLLEAFRDRVRQLTFSEKSTICEFAARSISRAMPHHVGQALHGSATWTLRGGDGKHAVLMIILRHRQLVDVIPKFRVVQYCKLIRAATSVDDIRFMHRDDVWQFRYTNDRWEITQTQDGAE